jgi:tetratricopeptide (TPR) repeat protein
MPSNHARILAQAAEALQAGQTARALELAEPLLPFTAADPELASFWLTLLRAAPDRADQPARVAQVIGDWLNDPPLVIRACDAWIRAAELTPSDQPVLPGGPAERAAEAARRCLATLGDADPTSRAYLTINLANALRLARRLDEALPVYEQALALAPERGGWWFNLGLLHKARHDFAAALVANQRARELLGDERPVLWNLAICAVALGQAELAVEVWRKLGLPARVGARGMPEVEGLSPVVVRVPARDSGYGPEAPVPEGAHGFELLRVSPLSPCHGVVQSASYLEAAADYGDVVLWDGTPVGVSERAGTREPIFPILSSLRRGDELRFRFVALQQEPGQVDTLGAALPDGALLFTHHERVQMLCPRCAAGDALHKHAHGAAEAHRLVYGKLVVAHDRPLKPLSQELGALLKRHPGVQLVIPGLYEALGDTPAAGKQHQLWRALEMKGSAASGLTPRR